jgi:hypothetical protein
MAPETHVLTLPGPMLQRGFWLYVWRVETPVGEMLYVGRTGDSSTPYAAAPYTRMGQHLGSMKNQNALRSHLEKHGIDPRDCANLHLISHGPLYPEMDRGDSIARAERWAEHVPIRDIVGAMEKALAEELATAGYTVLNTVKWRHPLDPVLWAPVRAAFAEHFPKLEAEAPA